MNTSGNSTNSPYMMETSNHKHHKHDQFAIHPKKVESSLPELTEVEEKSYVLLTAAISLKA